MLKHPGPPWKCLITVAGWTTDAVSEKMDGQIMALGIEV